MILRLLILVNFLFSHCDMWWVICFCTSFDPYLSDFFWKKNPGHCSKNRRTKYARLWLSRVTWVNQNLWKRVHYLFKIEMKPLQSWGKIKKLKKDMDIQAFSFLLIFILELASTNNANLKFSRKEAIVLLQTMNELDPFPAPHIHRRASWMRDVPLNVCLSLFVLHSTL